MDSNIFQKILWNSRLVIIFAVISGIFSTCIMVTIGTYEVYEAINELYLIFNNRNEYGFRCGSVVQHLVNSVDMYLIATVLLIFSVGLYELFIRKFDNEALKREDHGVLVVKNLEQLKTKLAQTIVMILIVSFFQKATQLTYNNPFELLCLGLGIFLMAIAVYFTHYKE